MGNFLTGWEPVSFSRRTLLHGVSEYISSSDGSSSSSSSSRIGRRRRKGGEEEDNV